METAIQKYEPMYEIELDDGRVFYLPQDKFVEFNKNVLNPGVWILYIDGWGFNKKQIKYINKPSPLTDPLKHCSPEIAAKVKTRIKQYENSLGGQLPNIEVIVKWIEKAKKGERL